jgi:predicted porin
MFGLEDYDIELGYTLADVGFIRAGIRQFTTWYDGSGGYIPGSGTPPGWLDPITPMDDELELDRGSVWFEAGLRMEDIPHITFGYEHQWRDGWKDSTFWERRNEAAPNSVRPGYYRIDETRDIFRLDVTHTLGNTDLGGGLRYHSVSNNNARYETRGGLPLQQQDISEYDLYSAHLYSQTRLADEKILLNFAYNITTLDSDFGGSRTTFELPYTGLLGTAESVSQVLNGSMWWNPLDDLVIIPSFRLEWWDQSAWGNRMDMTPFFGSITDSSDYEANEQTLACEARYTGVPNALLYARAEYSMADGDMVRSTINSGILNIDGFRATDSELDRQKYTLGANWYPAQGLSVAARYTHRRYDQDFSHAIPGLLPSGAVNNDDAQLRKLATQSNDANIRVTWRALPNLTFVTRYDYQQTDIDNVAFPNLPASIATTPEIRSGEITRHILTESVTWNPLEQLYLQLGLHWINSETNTPANNFAPGVVTDWDNDYWSASLNAGYAFSDDTELHASYYYYHADNYPAAIMPYGTISDEHVFSITLNHRINENMVWNLRYGYYTGDDDAAGGFNDYEAHMVSTGVRLSF